MERLSSQPEPTIKHFSHPHPLQLSTPAYPNGFFNCDACGKPGNGFSYHCKSCCFDLHILCASMPLSIAHHQYHHHQLNLWFSPPYAHKSFYCDICKQAGYDHWHYRCDICNFDAHLSCAGANPPPPPATTPVQTPIQPILTQPYQISPTAHVQVIQVPIQPTSQLLEYRPTFPVQAPGTSYGARPLHAYPQNNNIVNNSWNNMITFTNQIIQGFVDGAAQAVGQALFQGFMGGGASDGSSFQGNDGGCNL